MPKLSGVFDIFKSLDSISPTESLTKLQGKTDIHTIGNFLGNRILYPQTISTTLFDLEIDYEILKQAVISDSEVIFDKKSQNLTISQEFTSRFPPFINLVTLLIDALNPEGLIGLYIKNDHVLRLGTIVSKNLSLEALKDLKEGVTPSVSVDGALKQLQLGTVNLLPYKGKNLKLKIGDKGEVVIPGGDMGIFLDLRSK